MSRDARGCSSPTKSTDSATNDAFATLKKAPSRTQTTHHPCLAAPKCENRTLHDATQWLQNAKSAQERFLNIKTALLTHSRQHDHANERQTALCCNCRQLRSWRHNTVQYLEREEVFCSQFSVILVSHCSNIDTADRVDLVWLCWSKVFRKRYGQICAIVGLFALRFCVWKLLGDVISLHATVPVATVRTWYHFTYFCLRLPT